MKKIFPMTLSCCKKNIAVNFGLRLGSPINHHQKHPKTLSFRTGYKKDNRYRK